MRGISADHPRRDQSLKFRIRSGHPELPLRPTSQGKKVVKSPVVTLTIENSSDYTKR